MLKQNQDGHYDRVSYEMQIKDLMTKLQQLKEYY